MNKNGIIECCKQDGLRKGENMKIVVLEGSPHKKGSFEDVGMVLGTGCGFPSMTKNSRHMEEAYQLGKSL